VSDGDLKLVFIFVYLRSLKAMLKLETEQEELLSTLVEASRRVPREQRESFIAYSGSKYPGGWGIMHGGLPGDSIEVPSVDLNMLTQYKFVAVSYRSKDSFNFDVSPYGIAYYEEMKARAGQATQRIEAEVKTYLDADGFRCRYPGAYMKWTDAESKLWGSDSADQLTTIGHLCRESMQEFAKALIEIYKPEKVDPIMAHTKKRIQSVINARSERLGDTERPFLDALISYWNSIDDLTQRQEHGAQKEGKPLLWEDGRRLVFQTAVVMFEIDRALSRP
jgi:hypothetical protein